MSNISAQYQDPTDRSNPPSQHLEHPYPSPRRPLSTPDLKAPKRRSSLFHTSTPHSPSRKLKKSTATRTRSSGRPISENFAGTRDTSDRPWTGSSSTTQVPAPGYNDAARYSFGNQESIMTGPSDGNGCIARPVALPAPAFSTSSRLATLHAPVRHSSLRFESRLSRVDPHRSLAPCANMESTLTDDTLEHKTRRPRSHPPNCAGQEQPRKLDIATRKARAKSQRDFVSGTHESWQLPPFREPSISRSSSRKSAVMPLKPKPSFTRLHSLDSLITYREEKAEWKRASSYLQSAQPDEDQEQHEVPYTDSQAPTRAHTIRSETDTVAGADLAFDEKPSSSPPRSPGGDSIDDDEHQTALPKLPPPAPPASEQPKNTFRTSAAEIGFCFTIAMTQFLAEYMISGFAIELPKIMNKYASNETDPGSM